MSWRVAPFALADGWRVAGARTGRTPIQAFIPSPFVTSRTERASFWCLPSPTGDAFRPRLEAEGVDVEAARPPRQKRSRPPAWSGVFSRDDG
jgi:hypothetical protein